MIQLSQNYIQLEIGIEHRNRVYIYLFLDLMDGTYKCKGCKMHLPRSEFISSRTPSKITLKCTSCRKIDSERTARSYARNKSRKPKKSSAPKPHAKPAKPMPKKSSPVDCSSDDQDSSSTSCPTTTRAPRKPLCNQDFATLLHEQDYMCAGPDKTISPSNFCLNNEFGRRITVLNNIDHIEKYAEGGSSKIANLQLLCHNCHGLKCSLERKNENGQSMTKEERDTLKFFTKPKEIYN